jgi:hypothetical protein
MSTLLTVLVVLGALLLVLFLGGVLAVRRRDREHAPEYAQHLADADHALEQARASDRGWDRATMEQVVREALAGQRPGVDYDRLELVLVDDRPGVEEDRAHFEAVGEAGRLRVVLARSEVGWAAERVG